MTVNYQTAIIKAYEFYNNASTYAYFFGAKGQVLTDEVMNSLWSSYPDYFSKYSASQKTQIYNYSRGKIGYDCSGLIAEIIGDNSGSAGQWSHCTDITTPQTCVQGALMYKPGHIGIAVGNGQFIHIPQEMHTVELVNVSSYNWQSAGKSSFVDYTGSPANTEGSSGNTICIWMGWTNYESGYNYGTPEALSRMQTTGQAYGQYQFDYRYGLVPFMQYAQSTHSVFEFSEYIALGPGNEQLVNNTGLHNKFIQYASNFTDDFLADQNACGLKDYLLPAIDYIQNNYGYDITQKGDVVIGSLFSMAIRSGSQTAAQKYANCENMSPSDIINVTYDTYGDSDAGRWNNSAGSQRVKALNALINPTDIYCIDRDTGYPGGYIPPKPVSRKRIFFPTIKFYNPFMWG